MVVFSLVAPVQPDGDVSLDVAALVLGQVTGQQLPPQVDELQHHVADLVEQIHFVFLVEREARDGVRVKLKTLQRPDSDQVHPLKRPEGKRFSRSPQSDGVAFIFRFHCSGISL